MYPRNYEIRDNVLAVVEINFLCIHKKTPIETPHSRADQRNHQTVSSCRSLPSHLHCRRAPTHSCKQLQILSPKSGLAEAQRSRLLSPATQLYESSEWYNATSYQKRPAQKDGARCAVSDIDTVYDLLSRFLKRFPARPGNSLEKRSSIGSSIGIKAQRTE